MLQRLDKLGPYALVLVLGYLTYTTAIESHPGLTQGQSTPEISAGMLKPTLIEPTGRASGVDRDPFEVEWASYLIHAEARRATSQPASTQPAKPATRPAEPPKTRPATIPLPPVPDRLSGVFLGRAVRIAVIGPRIYKVGSLIGGSDPATCWQIEAIEVGHVVIRFGDVRRVLRITSGKAGAGPAHRVEGR